MKLTIILLTAGLLHAGANGIAQQVSLSLKNAPLEKAFDEIKKQTGYQFFYKDQWMDDAKKVDVQVYNVSLEAALNLCFKEQPFTYEIVEKTIVVKQKQQNSNGLIATDQLAPPITVTGRITDDEGNPLVGATVKIKGSPVGVKTDGDGRFILKDVDANATIEISYVGFVEQSLEIKGRTNLAFTLNRSDNILDQVIIQAYDKTTERLKIGNIGKVKGEDIRKQPVSNPLLALEGRVPGLFITQNSGVPGGGVTVRIQGQSSISAGNDPLYVIDGVPYVSQMLTTTAGGLTGELQLSGSSSYQPGGQGNPLSYINPEDIESIEILKDADATSIYGSRAANGAILITTRKGKAGQTKIEVNAQQGWGKVTKMAPMMNTQQYLEMRKEALRNDNATMNLTTGDYDINGLWDTTRYTNWQKALIGGTANYSNINASVSGGTTTTQYLVGGTYHRETTVFPDNSSDVKAGLHFNLTTSSTNQKFRLQLSGSYMNDDNHLPYQDYTTLAYSLPPDAPAIYNPDGTLNWAPNIVGNSSWRNPLAQSINRYNNTTTNLVSSTFISYQLIPGLTVNSRFGYTILQTDELSKSLLASSPPESRTNPSSRTAGYTTSTIKILSAEPQVNYIKAFGKSKAEIILGGTIQKNSSEGTSILGFGYVSDDVMNDVRSASTLIFTSTVDAVYKYNAGYAKLNYNYDNKYVLDLSARRDGSTRFGPNNRFHNFGAVGAAWIFTLERFLKSFSFLSFGKLKGSYGTSGNDQVGDYTFMDLYNSNLPLVPYQGGPGSIVPTKIPNPDLQWEDMKKLSIGLDLGFLKDRFLVSIFFQRNRSSNQLLPYQIPVISGFTSIPAINFPATVQNRSWEFSLQSTNVKNKNFSWTTNVNLTIPKNKLIAFPNLSQSSYASSLIIGQPVNIVTAYKFLGVNPATGIYQFDDGNGNPISSPSYRVPIDISPKFYGGVQNNFSYKGLQLDFLFQFVKQTSRHPLVFGANSAPGKSVTNQPVSVIDRWQKPGDIATIERYANNNSLFTNWNNASTSTGAFFDGSFIRLKNVSITYDLPAKAIKKAKMQYIKITASGQNLLTITKFPGLDPESTSSYTILPPLRIYTIGLQIGL